MRIRPNKLILTLSVAATLLVISVYVFALIFLPKILNSDKMVAKYEQFLSEKVGFQVDIDDFQFKTNPNLSFEFSLKEVSSLKDEIYVNDLYYKSKILSIKPKILTADKVYLDVQRFNNVKKDKPKKNLSFDIDKIPYPVVNISELVIKLNKEINIKVENIKSIKKNSRIETSFLAQIIFNKLDKPVYIGREGKIIYTNKPILDNLSIETNNLKLTISGVSKKVNITGLGLPAKELEETFLYFYKYRHPNKKNFIENFSDFKGYIDVNLSVDKNGIYGKCYAKELAADFWTHKIPVYLPAVEFFFDKRQMKAKATGKFGPEPVYTDVVINGVATKNLHTVGNVKAPLTNKFTKKYFPLVTINGVTNAEVKYDTRNEIVNVYYTLDIPKGNNLLSKFGNLDNTNIDRKIHAHTVKNGDEIKLEKYAYSFVQAENNLDILYGDGIFKKYNNRYRPYEITIKTNGEVQLEIIKSFIDNYFDTGKIIADLKLSFIDKLLQGTLIFKNVRRNNFAYMNLAEISATGNKIRVNANGMFFEQPISIKLNAENNFNKGLVIDNVDINLKKYYLKKGNIDTVKSEITSRKNKSSNKNKRKQTSDYKIEIKKGRIYVGEIVNPRFYLHDVVINGSFKNNTVNFVAPETEYAKGHLSAIGNYNVVNHSSDIYFVASDIDSNEVATKFYNLPNQFHGHSYANLHLISKNQLNDVRTESTFAIVDGFLPNLGDKEIKVKEPNKKLKKLILFANKSLVFTLSKISNIDFSKPNVFYSDLRGSFKTHNGEVKDVKIFSQSDNLSMLIEGNYKIKTQEGKLVVWGRHNKAAERKIRIFKVPLRLIYRVVFKVEKSFDSYLDKIEQIPPIKAKAKEEAIFRVNVEGNLNSDNLKMQFKDIRKGNKVPQN